MNLDLAWKCAKCDHVGKNCEFWTFSWHLTAFYKSFHVCTLYTCFQQEHNINFDDFKRNCMAGIHNFNACTTKIKFILSRSYQVKRIFCLLLFVWWYWAKKTKHIHRTQSETNVSNCTRIIIWMREAKTHRPILINLCRLFGRQVLSKLLCNASDFSYTHFASPNHYSLLLPKLTMATPCT